MEKHPDDKKPVVEYTAKITLPNGEVIEKTVSTEGISLPLRILTFLPGMAFSMTLTF